MRVRLFLACVSVSAGLIAGGLGVEACGGTSETTTNNPVDSGNETRADASNDAASDVELADAESTCDPNNDFLADVPDAAIPDSGATTGACVSCLKAECNPEIRKCAENCKCAELAADLVKCYVETQNILACGGGLGDVPSSTQKVGVALYTCLATNCQSACTPPPAPDGGDDGGPDAGEDAGNGG